MGNKNFLLGSIRVYTGWITFVVVGQKKKREKDILLRNRELFILLREKLDTP